MAEIQPLTLAEQYIARKLRTKLASAVHFLTESKAAALALTPAVLAQLGTQEALTALAKRLGELRDIAKGERVKPEQGGKHG